MKIVGTHALNRMTAEKLRELREAVEIRDKSGKPLAILTPVCLIGKPPLVRAATAS